MKKILCLLIVLIGFSSCRQEKISQKDLIESTEKENFETNCETIFQEDLKEEVYVYKTDTDEWENVLNIKDLESLDTIKLGYKNSQLVRVERETSTPSKDFLITNQFCFSKNHVKTQKYRNSNLSLSIATEIYSKNSKILNLKVLDLITGKSLDLYSFSNKESRITENEVLNYFNSNKPFYFWTENLSAFSEIPDFMKNYEEYLESTIKILENFSAE